MASNMLSERLQMLADMVTPGNRLVDVGCDHGYLSISLVASGICPRAIAMDVREGPLTAAKEHIAEAGLNDYIDVRLSDGLAEFGPGEADTMVCAGMGGRLMERILREGMEKACGLRELILQPQSELPQFRVFLREAGFAVVDENAVFEDGKYYFAMKAVYGWKAGGIADAAAGGGAATAGGRGAATAGGREAGRGAAASGGIENGIGAAKDTTAGENAGSAENTDGRPDSDAAERDGLQRLYDLYGELLLRRRHPLLGQYLRQRESYIRTLEKSLASAGTRKARQRLQEVRCELEDIETALGIYAQGLPKT